MLERLAGSVARVSQEIIISIINRRSTVQLDIINFFFFYEWIYFVTFPVASVLFFFSVFVSYRSRSDDVSTILEEVNSFFRNDE